MPFEILEPCLTDYNVRIALEGISKSGKSLTMLKIGVGLSRLTGKKFVAIDTEAGRLKIYAKNPELCDDEGKPLFKVIDLDNFSPTSYTEAIQFAEASGYGICGCDSMSHAWDGADGVLDLVDTAANKSGKGDKFAGWRDATPLHRKMVDTFTSCNMHFIATLRQKSEMVLEPNEKGKMSPRKVGVEAIQRKGFEFEFDIYATMDDAVMTVKKTRNFDVLNDAVIEKPGIELAEMIYSVLQSRTPEEQSALLKNRVLTSTECMQVMDELRRRGKKPNEMMAFFTNTIGRTDPSRLTVGERVKIMEAL